MTSRVKFVVALNVTLASCAYRLPAPMLPSQQRLKVVANLPDAYVLRLRIRDSRDYQVPGDGRVTLDVPGYRAGCSVYLFDKLRIQSGANPFTARTIDLVLAGKITQQLSLKDISALPLDAEAYHLLRVRVVK